MTRRRIALTVVASLACWVCLSGTAFAKPAPPAQWSATLCRALTDWQQTMKKDYDSLSNQINADSDVTGVPNQVTAYVDQLTALLGSLATAIQRDGAPNVHNGTKMQAAFTNAITKAKTDLAAVRQQAAALPTDSSDSLTTALGNVDDALTNATDPVVGTVDKLNGLDTSSKLVDAFAKQKSCKSYTL